MCGALMYYPYYKDHKIVLGNIVFDGMCKSCWQKVLHPKHTVWRVT